MAIHPVILNVESTEYSHQLTVRASVFHGFGNVTEAYIAAFEADTVALDPTPAGLKTFMTTNLTNLISVPVVKYDQNTIQTVVDTAYNALDVTANVDVDTDTIGYDICFLAVGYDDSSGAETHAFTFYKNNPADHPTSVSSLPTFVSGSVSINNAFVEQKSVRAERYIKGRTIAAAGGNDGGDKIEMRMYFLQTSSEGSDGHSLLSSVLMYDQPDAIDRATDPAIENANANRLSYTVDDIASTTTYNDQPTYDRILTSNSFGYGFMNADVSSQNPALILGNISSDTKSVYLVFYASLFAFNFKLEFYVNGTHVSELDYEDTTQSSKTVFDGGRVDHSLYDGAYGFTNVDFSTIGGGTPEETVIDTTQFAVTNANVAFQEGDTTNYAYMFGSTGERPLTLYKRLDFMAGIVGSGFGVQRETIGGGGGGGVTNFRGTVTINGEDFPVTLDSETDADSTKTPWVLVLNYVQQGGTTTSENVRTTSSGPPILPEDGNLDFDSVHISGIDPDGNQYTVPNGSLSENADSWGHTGNDLFNKICTALGSASFNENGIEVRFLAKISNSSKIIHFKSDSAGILQDFRTGDKSSENSLPASEYTLYDNSYGSVLPYHNAQYVPQNMNYVHSGVNDGTMTFGYYYWADGVGGAWNIISRLVDNAHASTVPSTYHQIWVRADAAGATGLSYGSAGTTQTIAGNIENALVEAAYSSTTTIPTVPLLNVYDTVRDQIVPASAVNTGYVYVVGTNSNDLANINQIQAATTPINASDIKIKVYMLEPSDVSGYEDLNYLLSILMFEDENGIDIVPGTSATEVGTRVSYDVHEIADWSASTIDNIPTSDEVLTSGAQYSFGSSSASSTVPVIILDNLSQVPKSIYITWFRNNHAWRNTKIEVLVNDEVFFDYTESKSGTASDGGTIETSLRDGAYISTNINLSGTSAPRYNTQTAFVPVTPIPDQTMDSRGCVRFNDNGTLEFQQFLQLSKPAQWNLDWTSEAFTIAFWIKVRSDDASTTRKVFSLGEAIFTNGVFEVIPSSGGSITFGGLTFNAVTGITADDTWHHVVMTCSDSTTFTLYVDNNVVTNTSGTFSLSGLAANAPIRIGKGNDASITYDHMKHTELDDFVVYKGQALDTNQINSMYTQGPEHVYSADNYVTSSGGATEQWILLNRDVLSGMKNGSIRNVGTDADKDNFETSWSRLGDLKDDTGDMKTTNVKSNGVYKFRFIPYLASDTTRLDPNSDDTRYLEWEQTSNPATTTDSISGFANAVHVGLNEGGTYPFGGLRINSQRLNEAWITGTDVNTYYYAAGAKTGYEGGIAFSGSGGNYEIVAKTELWVYGMSSGSTIEIADPQAPAVEPYAFWKFEPDGLTSDTSDNNHHLKKMGLNTQTANVIESETVGLQSEAYTAFVDDPYIVLANVQANLDSNTLDVLEGSLFSSFADIERYHVFAFDTANVDETLLTRANVTLFAETHLVSADLPDGHSNVSDLVVSGNLVYSGSDVPRYGVELLNNNVHLTHAFGNLLDSTTVFPIDATNGTYKPFVYAKDASGRTIGTAAEPDEIVVNTIPMSVRENPKFTGPTTVTELESYNWPASYTSGWEAQASSYLIDINFAYVPYRAFNKSADGEGDIYHSETSQYKVNGAHTLTITYPEPTLLKEYTLQCRFPGSNSRHPVKWKLQGTNESITASTSWEDIKSFDITVPTLEPWDLGETKLFDVSDVNTTEYTSYRLFVTDTYNNVNGKDDGHFAIGEWVLYTYYQPESVPPPPFGGSLIDYSSLDQLTLYLIGTGWTEIKYLPGDSTTWFPGNDNLLDYGGTEFLFTTGDFSRWMIMDQYQVNGETYSFGTPRIVKKSSISDVSYSSAIHENRNGGGGETGEDPWVAFSYDDGTYIVMYGENANPYHTSSIHPSGMYVFVR